MVSGHRVIFHIDMNCFYASVEIAHHPELSGHPLAIAGRVEDRKGIIVTSSYEARAKGVKTTMPVWKARQLCPELIVKQPNMTLYRETSKQIFDILRRVTPLVEKVSVDEGYMDVSSVVSVIHPVHLAKRIQRHLYKSLKLPCSIGIAPNKFLAKMASNMQKPMGLTILRKRDLPTTLWNLPIGDMHGVGSKTEEKLKKMNIHTIGDLAKFDRLRISERLGQPGISLFNHANGWDDRPVDPESEDRYKSIGHSTTLPVDTIDLTVVKEVFSKQSEKIAFKLKREHIASYQISIVIRYFDWTNITRNKTLKTPLITKQDILFQAMELFHRHWDDRPVRLLGITLTSFEALADSTTQLDLFTYQDELKKEPVVDLINAVTNKYGNNALQLASSMIKNRKVKNGEYKSNERTNE
ncbi:DNA polymerase IV [Terrilactibacillus laevilacticus]|uniref:DNA polymerase IV n=1 Tax=Terrilactibacillus laevilacticus TaxID=1380157 RepID=A0ABW5PUW8_9BACI|nr:DNA polymerase IV [Terrilactibacillus laevilacticus]